MDDQHTTTTATNNSSEQAAEPDQQLLRAASSETRRRRRRRRRRRQTTARIPWPAVMRSYYKQKSAMMQFHDRLEASQTVAGANPTPEEADRTRSPRQPTGSHTANININTDIDDQHTTDTNPSQQAAEQPAINQHGMRRSSGLVLDPGVRDFLAREGENLPEVSHRVIGANPTPVEADRPRSPRTPRHYPQLAEIPRPRPIPPSVGRWYRPPLLSLIPHVSHDSGRPSDRHQ